MALFSSGTRRQGCGPRSGTSFPDRVEARYPGAEVGEPVPESKVSPDDSPPCELVDSRTSCA